MAESYNSSESLQHPLNYATTNQEYQHNERIPNYQCSLDYLRTVDKLPNPTSDVTSLESSPFHHTPSKTTFKSTIQETASASPQIAPNPHYLVKEEQNILKGNQVHVFNPDIVNQNIRRWLQEDINSQKSVKKIKMAPAHIVKRPRIQFNPAFTCPEYNQSDYKIRTSDAETGKLHPDFQTVLDTLRRENEATRRKIPSPKDPKDTPSCTSKPTPRYMIGVHKSVIMRHPKSQKEFKIRTALALKTLKR